MKVTAIPTRMNMEENFITIDLSHSIIIILLVLIVVLRDSKQRKKGPSWFVVPGCKLLGFQMIFGVGLSIYHLLKNK